VVTTAIGSHGSTSVRLDREAGQRVTTGIGKHGSTGAQLCWDVGLG
jgi:hypothetical protein